MHLFVRRDLDGFFGLFVDNLVQLLLIVSLCGGLCGMTGEDAGFLYARILPGAAISILFGNLFYAWQAHRLARRECRTDVTALPYGINTPSLLVYMFFVMAPVYRQTGSAEQAWLMGLLACLGSGVIEFAGAFVAEAVRTRTPRAALLSTLAGIAIGFISMAFALKIWAYPLIAMVPTGIVLITYFSKIRFPLGLPGGFVAVVVGSLLAWTLPDAWTGRSMAATAVSHSMAEAGLRLPIWSGGAIWQVVQLPKEQWLGFVSVIIPMGLFNVIGSLQNIESSEAAGDRYDTRASLAANGIGTILAACFGSCFPTTIYIGHPGWKGMGARAGYSTMNGLVVTLICLTGTVALVNSLIPIEAGLPIVLWIGIIITAQAFQATPREHAPAVAVGLFPAIAGWGATVVLGTFFATGGMTLQQFMQQNPSGEVSGFALEGLLALERGHIFTCMFMAALSVCLIERKFFAAAGWAVSGAGLTVLGLCHAYEIVGNDVRFLLCSARPMEGSIAYRAVGIAVGYGFMAVLFVWIGLYVRSQVAPAEAG